MNDIRKQLAILAAAACMVTAGCTPNSIADTQDQNSTAEASETEDPAEESADPDTEEKTDSAVKAEKLSALSMDELPDISLSKSDQNVGWDNSSVTLKFDGDTVTPSSTDGISIENGAVTITKGGDYVLSGTLDDGCVIVNLADEKEKVHIILNGVSLSCSTGAPLTVLQADKTVITLADGTQNALSDAKTYTVFADAENQYPNACLAAKSDLTINGGGELTVTGNYKNGIHCSDDLRIVSGTISVTAENNGIRGNDSVVVYGGTTQITSGGDGIKSTTADKDAKGFVYLAGGTVTVNSQQDGIDAATSLLIADGTLDITSGGGTDNADAHTDEMFGGFGGGKPDFGNFDGSDGNFGGFGGGRPDRRNTDDGGENQGGFGGRDGRSRPDSESGGNFTDDTAFMPAGNYEMTANTTKKAETADSAESTSDSRKGIKAEQTILVFGGTVTINSADDAVHSNNDITVTGNSVLEIAAGDDGIHADASITVNGGSINITQSYEGIESAEITVKDGTVRLVSTDDGFNASDGSGGGMGFNRNGSGELNFDGGYVYVNAGGDGLDSNGNITMTAGTVIVCGPTNDGNGPLDAGDNNNKITVTGGTLIAVGSTGMMDTPEANYLAATDLNAAAGDLIVVTDAKGTVLAALKTPKQAQGIVVSADGMADGYYIYKDGTYDGDFNEDNFATGGTYTGGTLIASGNGGGSGFGGFGGFRGRKGGDPNGDMSMPDFGNFNGDMTPPDGFNSSDFDGQNPPAPPDFDNGQTPPDFGGQDPRDWFAQDSSTN